MMPNYSTIYSTIQTGSWTDGRTVSFQIGSMSVNDFYNFLDVFYELNLELGLRLNN